MAESDLDPNETCDVLIVGAGISGLGMAAHLRRACPGKRFQILERRARVGGTWDLFRYPGVRSDSDMHTLGFAFAPWRDERAIAPGESIRGYLEQVAADHGIAEHIRFGRRVVAANWNSVARRWAVRWEADDGTRGTATARFLFLGSGYYDHDRPHEAEITGLSDFAGPIFHPQFWPDGVDLSGKRVVVIGSGATAVSLVPALAAAGAKVTMLQRTPSWYLTIPGRDWIAESLRRWLPERLAYRLTRTKNVRMQRWFFNRSRNKPAEVTEFLTRQVRKRLGKAFDAEAFTPPYKPWEQRLCLVPDGDFFRAVRSGKAKIVTARIASVEADGIRLDDGRHLAADAIVTATGLRLAMAGNIAVSLNGEPVHFAERFYYRNAMLSNVPNFAVLFGYLNASWTLRVDIVADWLCRVLRQMDAWGVDVVTPVLAPDHSLVEEPVLEMFSSGYLRRGRHLVPKSATTAPWQISMDYHSDRRALRRAPIDDGVLRFARIGAPIVA
ncbi:MAG: NAD(P)/FAD-dependent oxidoreductase [Novosphingobium sp.]|nr:NAD(P)/FAD-dependent oxidoreductase [Novosphingobium sp.]